MSKLFFKIIWHALVFNVCLYMHYNTIKLPLSCSCEINFSSSHWFVKINSLRNVWYYNFGHRVLYCSHESHIIIKSSAAWVRLLS